MKMRNKGKVHPSPCSSSSSSSVCSNNDAAAFSVLKLLPAVILTIISVLSGEDREVLAYMITRSMKATNPSSLFLDEKNRKNTKKQHSNNNNNGHKSPLFDCECFECYTGYWVRWDSSPNRELIHQAIEAFEEHLSMGEKSKKVKNKKKDKMGRRGIEERLDFSVPKPALVINELSSPEIQETVSVSEGASLKSEEAVVETGESSQLLPKEEKEEEVVEEKQQEMVVAPSAVVDEQPVEKKAAVVVSGAGSSNHKGLARKVLPDVLGLLNSRLWSLWSPNV